ncbi:aldo/keto reductase [Agromyces atrinae]|uniref:Aldo/keto reductase n=1 Tax=Agromyces atrinae TaxID=592376 RepID=A0A4Q2MDT3_9MICO|nr:aldo/keto reductase [Agromyces atrinae]NYD67475.1 D-threo-aldose 1-dehydrogenase [Agromyces atrinae]RXZ88301.1 aldo/keto reductase [Agromyces atrinae]
MTRSTVPPFDRASLGALGLGAAPLGNLYRAIDDDSARAVVDGMWDGGVRYFDTAPHYGLGLSERRLGAALAERPRDEYVISTKIGRVLEPVANPDGALDDGFVVPADRVRRWDFSADGVRRSLDESLERLGLDRVDIVYVHDPDDHLEQAIAEALPALVALRDEGIVGAIGVGANSADVIARFIETGDLDLAMVAGRYTLLEQPALADVFPAAERHGTGVVAVGVYNSGLLATSTPSADAHYNYGPVPADVLARARELAAVCAAHDVELPHAAVQFALRHPLVVNATVGVGKPHHVASTIRYATAAVPDALWVDLADRGLIPAGH